MNLAIPAKEQWAIRGKRLLVILGFIALFTLGCLFIFTGHIRLLERLAFRLKDKWLGVKAAETSAIMQHNASYLSLAKTHREELEQKAKSIEREREKTKLKIEGMSTDEIADALRAKGL